MRAGVRRPFATIGRENSGRERRRFGSQCSYGDSWTCYDRAAEANIRFCCGRCWRVFFRCASMRSHRTGRFRERLNAWVVSHSRRDDPCIHHLDVATSDSSIAVG